MIVVASNIYFMETSLRPSVKPSPEKTPRDEQLDKEILSHMCCMVCLGLTVFLAGYAVWEGDKRYCSTIRTWRREIRLPWGILLEGEHFEL